MLVKFYGTTNLNSLGPRTPLSSFSCHMGCWDEDNSLLEITSQVTRHEPCNYFIQWCPLNRLLMCFSSFPLFTGSCSIYGSQLPPPFRVCVLNDPLSSPPVPGNENVWRESHWEVEGACHWRLLLQKCSYFFPQLKQLQGSLRLWLALSVHSPLWTDISPFI